MLHTPVRFKTALGLTLVLAAGAAPTAAAMPQSGATSGGNSNARLCSEACSGSGYVSVPTQVNRGPCSEACSARGYHSQLPSATPTAETGARLPHDPRPRSIATLSRGVAVHSAPAPFAHVVTHDTGFDWGDAAIGAGGAIALLLVGGGATYATTARRSRRFREGRVTATG
jgi:hypothetical protein